MHPYVQLVAFCVHFWDPQSSFPGAPDRRDQCRERVLACYDSQVTVGPEASEKKAITTCLDEERSRKY